MAKMLSFMHYYYGDNTLAGGRGVVSLIFKDTTGLLTVINYQHSHVMHYVAYYKH